MPNQLRQIKGAAGYAAAVIGTLAMTGIIAVADPHTNSTTAALALLLVVLVVATLSGSRAALIASLLGGVSFNFFFLPPYYTWHIAEPENWIAFGAFVSTALIAGQLSSYARRRADESEIRRREIERLYDELRLAFEQASHAEAIKQSEQLKSALLDAVTHDLRTPLTSIKASVTTLIEDARAQDATEVDHISLDAESRNEFLDIINEETDRLNRFIGGMVDLALIEAGKLDQRKSWNRVGDIVQNACSRARARIREHELTVDIQPNLSSVFIDAQSASEVLYNLLDNAAKYSPKHSRIRVSAALDDNETITFSVEDCGRGIDASESERIFEKFYRIKDNDIHTTAGGLGLGLAIAKGIAESQDGSIGIGKAGDGFVTRFEFRVPVEVANGDHPPQS